MSVDLGFTTILLLPFFFVSYSPHSLNRTQPKPATCSEVCAIWKCMCEIWGIASPKNHLFWRLSNFKATVTAYIFRMKHEIHNWASALIIQGLSYIVSKYHELWSTNSLKLDLHLLPPYINFTFCFIARLRRPLSKRKLTKLCQAVDSKSR